MNMEKDVHTEHCCIIHGCKYGDDDCTVVSGEKPQSYLCEDCDEDGIKSLQMLQDIANKKIPTCPHCGHIL